MTFWRYFSDILRIFWRHFSDPLFRLKCAIAGGRCLTGEPFIAMRPFDNILHVDLGDTINDFDGKHCGEDEDSFYRDLAAEARVMDDDLCSCLGGQAAVEQLFCPPASVLRKNPANTPFCRPLGVFLGAAPSGSWGTYFSQTEFPLTLAQAPVTVALSFYYRWLAIALLTSGEGGL